MSSVSSVYRYGNLTIEDHNNQVYQDLIDAARTLELEDKTRIKKKCTLDSTFINDYFDSNSKKIFTNNYFVSNSKTRLENEKKNLKNDWDWHYSDNEKKYADYIGILGGIILSVGLFYVACASHIDLTTALCLNGSGTVTCLIGLEAKFRIKRQEWKFNRRPEDNLRRKCILINHLIENKFTSIVNSIGQGKIDEAFKNVDTMEDLDSKNRYFCILENLYPENESSKQKEYLENGEAYVALYGDKKEKTIIRVKASQTEGVAQEFCDKGYAMASAVNLIGNEEQKNN